MTERHDAVGAYALGVLEPYDALCCAEHLAVCGACALRLAELAEVASALAQLTGREPLDPPVSYRAGHGVPHVGRRLRVRDWLGRCGRRRTRR
ncbi:hypothetical protein I3F58_09170 [Streptomyces sp. MUM 203J]|uniref:hypothetical protein n=1 Tax=Streptomyces sp. MUM 203J TaxID=2791990 RepID=UPI001F04778F|nr:hypothetical protein [Streptomyces sp. MUM 203J]MCH0539730.1 hypothetical protein [Streptomyces sp. MUM 203J]